MMKRHGRVLALAAAGVMALGIAGVAATSAQAGGSDKQATTTIVKSTDKSKAMPAKTKAVKNLVEMKADNEAQLAWYRDHGIAVTTVVKSGYAWAASTEAELRQAAAVKGATYVPKAKG